MAVAPRTTPRTETKADTLEIGIPTDLAGADPPKGVANYVVELMRHLGGIENLSVRPMMYPPNAGTLTKTHTSSVLARRADVDVLHVPAPRLYYAPLFNTAVPTVVTAHALDMWFPPEHRAPLRKPALWMRQRLLPRLRHGADAIVTVSAFLRDELVSNLDVDPARVHPIHHGITDAFGPEVPGRDGHYLVTDTPDPQLASVYAGLRDAGVEHDLVVVSERGYGTEQFERVLRRAGYLNAVRFEGYVPRRDLAAWFAGADCYLRWAPYEGFGLPPIEAMACGTPVVTNDGGSLPEVVGDGGRVCASEEEMHRAVLSLLDDAERRTALAIRGREWSERYSWERCAREHERVYRGVVGGG